jgi:hypothetical protein
VVKRVLCACEESQVVTIELRKIGIEAYSCDLQDCSGGHPEWHIKNDVTKILNSDWDMIIAFPPCTHLCVSGAAWFDKKRKDGRQQQGIDFFKIFTDLKCKHTAIENPVGIMSNLYRKPDQIINPWQFGDSASKATCLWLKNLPLLHSTNIVDVGERIYFESGKSDSKWHADSWKLSVKDRSIFRSRTFSGIGKAMAQQWGNYILSTVDDFEFGEAITW